MNSEDRGMLVGMVMGDGYLNVRNRLTKDGYKYVSSEIKISHSIAQLDYAKYKADLVRRIFGGKCNIYYFDTPLKTTGKTYPMCAFMKSNSYFRILKKFMYVDKIKYITSDVLNMLTPHGIAIWYMDDGHARRNISKDGFVSSVSTEIATCCSYEEVTTVINWFQSKYGIQFKPFKHVNGSFMIRCNTKDSHEFARLIQPFIIPSMLYKLSHVADLNLHECRTPIGTCKICNDVIYDNRRRNMCCKCYTRQLGDDIVRTNGNKEPLEIEDKELQ
jgi:hypothetical protein